MAKKLEHVHLASTIKLNVGGQYFTTSLQTLTKDKGSMLHATFSGWFDTKPAEDGTYFIDRDGTHFRYILNYLRTGRLLFPKDELIREELLEEAEFYQIRGILEELRHPKNQPFKDSTVLSTEHKQVLINNFLKEQLSDESNFVLIYRASRDGWHSSKFHALCDDRGPTVTVVKNGNNIFGGYTEMSWEDGKHWIKEIQWRFKPLETLLGSFNNDDGDGNENGKKAIGLFNLCVLFSRLRSRDFLQRICL